ncbi:TPA: hypothetical protein DCQ22_03795 [Candidatus Nomurabacteria bacterium]|nr:hypothetical protein [Candidatus Nomurabacteria bacterium]HBY20742.1 hypothetical protein [Clostridiales bacterium]
MAQLKITRLPKTNTLIVKQEGGNDFFVGSRNCLVINIPSYIFILQFLVQNNLVPHQVLEGILEDYHTGGSNLDV